MATWLRSLYDKPLSNRNRLRGLELETMDVDSSSEEVCSIEEQR